MLFKITQADMSDSSINKDLWSRRAHIIKYLLIGGFLMQAISLISETVSMGNFFNLYLENSLYAKTGAFSLAFAMEFLIRGLVMYGTIELYFAVKKETDDDPTTNIDVIDIIIITVTIVSLLGLVYLSIFVSKRGTHDSFENAGINRNQEEIEQREIDLETKYNAKITSINKEFASAVSPIEEDFARRIESKTNEINAAILKIRTDSIYWSQKTYNGKSYARKCKDYGKDIQALEVQKQQAIQSLMDQKDMELVNYTMLKSSRVTSAEKSYKEAKDKLKTKGESDNKFLNIFSDIVSFIAGYSVLFFMAFQILYVLILLKIGFKPNLALDKKHTRISFIDVLQEIWGMITSTLLQLIHDVFAFCIELFTITFIKPIRWMRKGLRNWISDIPFVKFIYLSDEEDDKNKTKSSNSNPAKNTTNGTTNNNNSTPNSTTNGTTANTTTKSSTTTTPPTNGTTKNTTTPKKPVATATTPIKGKDVVHIDNDIVVIKGVVYAMWRGMPKDAGFLRQQLVNNEGFLNRNASGRNPTTITKNIKRLNFLLKRIEEVTKENLTTV